jgi:hypothetical protein
MLGDFAAPHCLMMRMRMEAEKREIEKVQKGNSSLME